MPATTLMPALPAPLGRGPQGLIALQLVLLVCLGLAWELWWAPLRPGGSWLAIKIVPLLAAVPGLWMRRVYTARWLCLLLWLYVLEGLVRVSSDHGLSQGLAALELLLCAALFGSCVWGIRSSAQLNHA